MKAVVFDRPGPPDEVLAVRDVPTPTPRRGEVRVRMLASPVNPSDLLYVRGSYTVAPKLPATPGFEGVGVVESSGGGLLGRFLVGRRVVVMNDRTGNWAEYAVASAKQCIPVPSELADEQAATFFVNPATALAITRHVLNVPPGEWLLQTAAGSALGKMVIRLGKESGFRTVNVVRRREQIDELKNLGADHVLCDADGPLPEQVKKLVPGGVRYAMDAVGGATGSQVVECLSSDGRLVVYGTLSGEPIALDPRTVIGGSLRIEGFWLGHWAKSRSLPKKLRLIRQIRGLIRSGVLASDVAATYPLDRVTEAVRKADAPAKGGKVLLTIAGE
ncbi:MAG TPA: zinc-dependent alcohol dehydrogenase family protein [Fimbriiglobus sp.]|nr:zinc-dependent alcohol dehydrogenase family protein [Fimbriiglobus sp.]